MKKFFLGASLLLLLTGCKNKELTKPSTTDFRENYTGTFNIKYHKVATIQAYHIDTTYYELTEISYQLNDSIDKGFAGNGKFPAIRFRKTNASSDTTSWVLGIDGNGTLHYFAPGLSGGFVTVDSINYEYSSFGSSGSDYRAYLGKRI